MLSNILTLRKRFTTAAFLADGLQFALALNIFQWVCFVRSIEVAPVKTELSMRNIIKMRIFSYLAISLYWLLLAFLPLNSAFSQHFDNELPLSLTKSPTLQYEEVLHTLRERDPIKRKVQAQFYLENIFLVNGLLKSGIIIQDSMFTQLCKGIMRNLTKNNAEVEKKMKYYIVQSAAVNAFATFDGSIFLCRGLLERITSEAQLAFIISHEYIHIREAHAFGIYKHNELLQKGTPSRNILRNNTAINKSLFEKCQFGQSLELEADIRAFSDYFAGSGYSIAAMSQTLDLLRYSYLPPQKTTFFDLKSILYPLDTAEISYVFNENNRLYTDNYSLPKAYYLDEARSILGENEHQNDSLSTHPNLHKRRITMHGMLDSLRIPDGTGRDFITYTKETWEKWLASEKHYSLPKLYLELHSIEEAIYSAKYPSYCITDALITAKALLQLTQFRNNPAESIPIESDNYQYVEGEMQRLAFTLEKLDAQEVNALTLHYTWLLAELYKSYPDSSLYCSNISLKKETVFNKLAMKALEEWVEYHSEDPNFFYDANTSIIHKELTNGKSEKTAITMGNDADFPAIVNKNYIHYALQFVNLSPNGKPLPTEIQELVVKKRKYEAFLTKEVSNIDKKEKSDDGERFGLNKVIIVNPFVAFSDLRLKDKTLYQEMEKKGVEFNQLLSQNAKSVGIDVEILSTNNLKQSDN
ncbi:MAG: hypothetical protein RI894_475, partial [Bacteroidota bacterium]